MSIGFVVYLLSSVRKNENQKSLTECADTPENQKSIPPYTENKFFSGFTYLPYWKSHLIQEKEKEKRKTQRLLEARKALKSVNPMTVRYHFPQMTPVNHL